MREQPNRQAIFNQLQARLSVTPYDYQVKSPLRAIANHSYGFNLPRAIAAQATPGKDSLSSELRDNSSSAQRLAKVRDWMTEQGFDAYLQPRSDEYLGEYVPLANERLAWLTNFKGSAGMALVGHERAALFVDGRYTLQARQQTDQSLFDYGNLRLSDVVDWLSKLKPPHKKPSKPFRLALDPWLVSERLRGDLKNLLAERAPHWVLKPCFTNPVDRAWGGYRPPAPLGLIKSVASAIATVTSEAKLASLAQDLAKQQANATVLTAPDLIAWLLNIRGNDVANCPLPLSYAILIPNHLAQDSQTDSLKVEWFVDKDKLALLPKERPAWLKHFSEGEFCERLAIHRENKDLRFWLDPEITSAAVFRLLGGKSMGLQTSPTSQRKSKKAKGEGATPVKLPHPLLLARAQKSPAEQEGMRQAHYRDGRAVIRFMAWLAKAKDGIKSKTLDEMGVVAKLQEFRAAESAYCGDSFDTIAGSGPHGAIIHYRVSQESNRLLQFGELLLLDSGGQYEDGTTDVTRTLAIGRPSKEARLHYSLVLKGHLQLAMIRFPQGTKGSQLDILARAALWQQGLDYAHGTGHGVGTYLSVHEGPQRITQMGGDVALAPGMVLSNEPGYYQENVKGIRIENLQMVMKAENVAEGDHWLGFETLTMIPYDRQLIQKEILSPAEIAFVDDYHREIFRRYRLRLSPKERAWLKTACAPL